MVKTQPGGFVSNTDDKGRYYFRLPFGIFQIEPVIQQGTGLFLDSICPNPLQTVVVDSSHSDSANFGVSIRTCPFLKVYVNSPRRRRCSRNAGYLSVSNEGRATMFQPLLKLKLSRYVSMMEPGQWTWNPTDSTYQIQLDSLPALSNKAFNWIDSVYCTPEIMGKLQCTRAWVVPGNNQCLPNIPGWDKSIIKVKGSCQNGQNPVFILKNTGPGNMTQPRNFRLYVGAEIQFSSNYQLPSGDSLVIPVSSSSIKLQVDQGDKNPFGRWIEVLHRSCFSEETNGNLTWQLNYPSYGDESESCQDIRDSYDPNDNAAIPEGKGDSSFIRSGSTISYTIRFQNKGNDTAFVVRILDSLTTALDVSSYKALGSSHPYRFSLKGTELKPILEFRFSPISLPDSATDAVNSSGFVSFTLKLKSLLPEGRKIQNRAAIFFDQNDPVITNFTTHVLKDNYTVVSVKSEMTTDIRMLASPNPNRGKFNVSFPGKLSGSLVLKDIQGRILKTFSVTNSDQLEVETSSISDGLYFLSLENSEMKFPGLKILIGK